MKKLVMWLVCFALLLNISCVSAFAASPNEDIVLQMQDGKFKVYRDVPMPQSAAPAQKAASASQDLSRQVKSVSEKAAKPVKQAQSVSRSVSNKAKSVSRQAQSVSRRVAEPARKVSKAAKSQSRRISSVNRNAEKLYSDVMKRKSLMESNTWAEVETVRYVPETEVAAEPSHSKNMVKYVPVILAVAVAAAGTVLLIKKKADDRKDEGEYKSFQ